MVVVLHPVTMHGISEWKAHLQLLPNQHSFESSERHTSR